MQLLHLQARVTRGHAEGLLARLAVAGSQCQDHKPLECIAPVPSFSSPMLASQQGVRRSAQQLCRHLQPALAELAGCEHTAFSGRACSSSGAAAQEETKPVQAEVSQCAVSTLTYLGTIACSSPRCWLQIKRMMYRARQRGHLELDLLVGLWAEEHVPSLGRAQLSQLQTLLECENPDLFGWLTGQKAYPPELQDNSAFQVGLANFAALQQACHMPKAEVAGVGTEHAAGRASQAGCTQTTERCLF